MDKFPMLIYLALIIKFQWKYYFYFSFLFYKQIVQE